MRLDVEALKAAREVRARVYTVSTSDINLVPDRGARLDVVLDLYAQALTALFGEDWRQWAGPSHGGYLAICVRQGY